MKVPPTNEAAQAQQLFSKLGILARGTWYLVPGAIIFVNIKTVRQ